MDQLQETRPGSVPPSFQRKSPELRPTLRLFQLLLTSLSSSLVTKKTHRNFEKTKGTIQRNQLEQNTSFRFSWRNWKKQRDTLSLQSFYFLWECVYLKLKLSLYKISLLPFRRHVYMHCIGFMEGLAIITPLGNAYFYLSIDF